MKTFEQIRGNSIVEAAATAGDHEDAAHAHRTAAKQPKQDLRAIKAHEKAADHHDTAAKHLRTGNAYAAQNAHINAKNEADKAKDHGDVHSSRAHADTRAIGEGYASAAQRKAIWAAKNDKKNEAKSADVKPEKYTDAKGKTKIRMVPVVRENDANEATSPADLAKAMAAYKAKGGKVTKAPAAKAQGYHGKDDPGKDIAGIMDRPDTKKMGTRKKVKSMEGVEENYQVQKYTKGKKDGPAKSFGGDLKKATTHASKMGGDHRVHKEAKRTVTIDRPDRLTSMRVSKDKPPFDNAKPIQKDTKDRFGNIIKNRAKHLAKIAAKKAADKTGNKK